MPDFALPAPIPDANPDFRDASTCAEWLQSLPLINVGPSHGRLLSQIEELNSCDIAPGERLKIMELLRDPVTFVQSEHAKKFTGKAVPLGKPEHEIFNNVIALWDALAHGYEHCLNALADGGWASAGSSAALACQRALWCHGQKFADHFKAYQDIASDDWRRLHRLYAFAEQRGFTDQSVSHPVFKGDAEITAAESYAHALLMHLANPHEQTPRQQVIIARWLERWARKVAVTEERPADTGVPPLAADLEGSSGASRQPLQGDSVRYIELDDVGRSIRKRISLLRNGEPPEALGLGSDVPASMASGMLTMLYHQWCEDKTARTHARRPASKNARLSTGLSAIHYYITGEPFRQPGIKTELTQKERNEIATFGRVSTRHEETVAQSFTLEQWVIADESLAGFRIERPEDGGSGRFLHHQLVAIRPSDARVFILGTFRWLAVSENYELRAGVRALPGVPQGVAIRPTGLNAVSEKYVQALALPAVAALHSPPTLIIPAGWYKPRRVLEVHSDQARQLLLTGVLERGADFERCTYEAV